MRSKRFEALAKRPVNQDGFVKEWIEEGFIAMESPNDPKPSIKIVNGAVTELDGKPVSEFDLIRPLYRPLRHQPEPRRRSDGDGFGQAG